MHFHVAHCDDQREEITTLNDIYLRNGIINVQILDNGFARLDAGTMDYLVDMADFVWMIEQWQSIVINSLEEIVNRNATITKKMLIKSVHRDGTSPTDSA